MINRFAEMFKALSNGNRLRIFLRLASCCCGSAVSCTGDEQIGACVGELGKDLGIAPSTVSHHLKELRQAGLIKMERSGQTIECWIDPEVIEKLGAFFHNAGEGKCE